MAEKEPVVYFVSRVYGPDHIESNIFLLELNRQYINYLLDHLSLAELMLKEHGVDWLGERGASGKFLRTMSPKYENPETEVLEEAMEKLLDNIDDFVVVDAAMGKTILANSEAGNLDSTSMIYFGDGGIYAESGDTDASGLYRETLLEALELVEELERQR